MADEKREPVADFFPAVNRNLLDDLDRHLRGIEAANEAREADVRAVDPQAPDELPDAPGGTLRADRTRRDVVSVVEAVGNVAQSISAMTARIQDLEGQIGTLRTTNRDLEGQLSEASGALRAAEAQLREEAEKLRDERVKVSRLENVAAQQTARALHLEQQLSAAEADFASVKDAITAAFGPPDGNSNG